MAASGALALGAALLFALGTVLQQRVAAAATDAEAMRAGFLLRLARQPLWLAGIAVDAAGFVCQAAALGLGRIVVVQPVLASSVVFALPLGIWLAGQRVGRSEWVAAAIVMAGLAAFLVIGDPSGGRDDATAAGWIVAGAAIAAGTAALVLAARGRSAGARAALLGTATGLLFGLSAALTKATVERLDEGVVAVFTDWQVYALIAVGYASMSLSQASLQTGRLAPAVATQMVLDPVASVLIGTLAFGERLHETSAGAIASVAALAAMLGGLVVLAMAQESRPAPAAQDAPRELGAQVGGG
jgi:drug/metabolite transporter (DMT)-like permease